MPPPLFKSFFFHTLSVIMAQPLVLNCTSHWGYPNTHDIRDTFQSRISSVSPLDRQFHLLTRTRDVNHYYFICLLLGFSIPHYPQHTIRVLLDSQPFFQLDEQLGMFQFLPNSPSQLVFPHY
jgi:hypothetical protein